MSALPPKAAIQAWPAQCPLCAKSGNSVVDDERRAAPAHELGSGQDHHRKHDLKKASRYQGNPEGDALAQMPSRSSRRASAGLITPLFMPGGVMDSFAFKRDGAQTHFQRFLKSFTFKGSLSTTRESSDKRTLRCASSCTPLEIAKFNA